MNHGVLATLVNEPIQRVQNLVLQAGILVLVEVVYLDRETPPNKKDVWVVEGNTPAEEVLVRADLGTSYLDI